MENTKKNQYNEYQKKWRSEHKDNTAKYNKKYYEHRKEVKYGCKIIECECGCEIQELSKPRHIKTQKHLLLTTHSFSILPN
jgi:hypothetical protein